MKERVIELVKCFRHSILFINSYREKTLIIILGGEEIKYGNFSGIINNIGLLNKLGIRLVVVYGTYTQINSSSNEKNIKIICYKYI